MNPSRVHPMVCPMDPKPSPEPLFDEYGETYDDAMKKSIGFMGQNHDYYTVAKVDLDLLLGVHRVGEFGTVACEVPLDCLLR